jgi:DNA-binding NarL/FixJ family response regulator
VSRAPDHVSILVVDDEPLHRMLVRELVAEEPGLHVVAEAHHGARAVELAAVHAPDVIVLDLRMPTMDGLTALPLLREVAPAARIVVWSNDTELSFVRALEAGASQCVPKASSPKRLVEALHDRRARTVPELLGASVTQHSSTTQEV